MITAEFEQEVREMDIEALVDFAVGTEDFRLFAAKLDALRENVGRCRKYCELGFTTKIVLTVLRKKLDLIKSLSVNRQMRYNVHQRRWEKWRKRATSHGQYQMRSGRR